MSDNYYEELGVDPSASRDEIREAHRARIAELEAARQKKGVSEAQLQQNREEVARVRAAWNVLSDPFQRQRYDAQLASPPVDAHEEGEEPGTEVEPVKLKGWRKLMAPPPPRDTGGKNGKSAPPPRRQRPEPTIVLPEGMQLAEPRLRGMAMLFDVAVLIVIFFGVSLILPGLVQSDYHDISDRITKVNDLHNAQVDIDDAQSALKDAKTQSDKASATSDLKSAQKDFAKAEKSAKKEGVTSTPHNAKALQKQSDKLSDKIRGTQYITSLVTLVLALGYLVPITAKTGSTLGMRGRRIKVVRVDGSPVGWYAAFARFIVPLLVAIAIPGYGVLLGLAIVGWAYFDRNRMGVHDKLARTIVVAA